jgi:hypothetical protein
MDISVSRLNKRMALQLPAEFPLGLVFVVGKVRNLTNSDDEGGLPYFYLAENDHMLRCHLSERALEESSLNEGDMIRAGGHLAFDILQADYFLLARDIEVLPEHRPSRTTLAPILADIKKRSQAASLVPAELPDWVQQIAPPEYRQQAETTAEAIDALDGAASNLPPVEEPEPIAKLTAEPSPSPFKEPSSRNGLTDDLVAFLSEAMDSPDEVELTQEMVAHLSPAIKPERAQPETVQPPGKEADVQPIQPIQPIQPVQAETRIPWVIVLIVLISLIAFLTLFLVLALAVAR